MRAKSVPNLIKEGARQLQEVMQLQGKQVELLRAVAETVVQLRLRMDDIAGRSQEYRDAVSEMYQLAKIPPDSMSSVQAAVRYHISAVLREHVSAKELQKAGLQPYSSKDAKQAKRQSMLLLDISGNGNPIDLLMTMGQAVQFTRSHLSPDTDAVNLMESIGIMRSELSLLEHEVAAMLPPASTRSAAHARTRRRSATKV